MNINVYNKDSWQNQLVGLNGQSDKTKGTVFGNYPVLLPEMLSDIYVGDGLGKKIVSVVADDMTRNGFTITNDKDNKIKNEIARLAIEPKIYLAIVWARLFGGSLVVLNYKDGGKLDTPLNPKTVKGIDWIEVYESPMVDLGAFKIDVDVKSPYFGDYEVFRIYKTDGISFDVHNTRCLIFKGEPIPKRFTDVSGLNMRYWGMSALQPIYNTMSNFCGFMQGGKNLLYEAVIGKYKLSNLEQLLSEKDSKAIHDRMEIINMSKSIINAVILGENEDYVRDALSFAGIPDMIDKYMLYLSGVSDIPVTRLFGRAPAGLNATGESDSRNYYDMISAAQKNKLLQPLTKLVQTMALYLGIKQEVSIDFNYVWEPTEAEYLKMKKDQADIDNIYINNGVLSPEQVFDARFKNGYTFETNVEDYESSPLDNMEGLK